ncbi:hypothetical protein AVEN_147190-1 [Araneus ventricosus]|uniref:Uncharacterized protein n=1 Tax=Araneus ventricosus TaxID=182803 RepID=A0A4Y2BAF7_ARAVE|nr:hypothetical protein AVEN_147190-1 [Araneus ventricosus]
MQYRKWKETVQKINVWCALLYDTVIGPFFFAETSITANIYPNMLQIYAYPKCSIYNPLLCSNKMLGQRCSSILLELDYKLDILRATKRAHVALIF